MGKTYKRKSHRGGKRKTVRGGFNLYNYLFGEPKVAPSVNGAPIENPEKNMNEQFGQPPTDSNAPGQLPTKEPLVGQQTGGKKGKKRRNNSSKKR